MKYLLFAGSLLIAGCQPRGHQAAKKETIVLSGVIVSPALMKPISINADPYLALPDDSGATKATTTAGIRSVITNTGLVNDDLGDFYAYHFSLYNNNKQVFTKAAFYAAGLPETDLQHWYTIQLKTEIAENNATGILYVIDLPNATWIAADTLNNGSNAPVIDNRVYYINDHEIREFNPESRQKRPIADIQYKDINEEEVNVRGLRIKKAAGTLTGQLLFDYQDLHYAVPLKVSLR
ncbi:hypothetical protein [Chitinophaga arvensicola]|uniref:Uncharacterized protein n=1 Tax=Chitinophaga arvensicola TaxID=29529 RepID=A0A1I0RRA3_9BACT|nr:hypothetical protein [Chitinophaga arvensicola]SEW43877.1 hypothetical protein SAMN04488122_3269 [Chitinophaga arvensicola]